MPPIAYGIDLIVHQTLSTDHLSRGSPLRRRHACDNREGSHVTPVGTGLRRRFVMPGVAHAHESEHNEIMADVETQGPNDPGFRGFAGGVRMFPGSPMHVTKIIAGVLRRRYGEGEAPIPWRCLFNWGAIPNSIQVDGRGKITDQFFFCSLTPRMFGK